MKHFVRNLVNAVTGKDSNKRNVTSKGQSKDLKIATIHHQGGGVMKFRCPHCSTENVIPGNATLSNARTCSNGSCGEQIKVIR